VVETKWIVLQEGKCVMVITHAVDAVDAVDAVENNGHSRPYMECITSKSTLPVDGVDFAVNGGVEIYEAHNLDGINITLVKWVMSCIPYIHRHDVSMTVSDVSHEMTAVQCMGRR
jgi:hypothetical protein